MQFSIRWQFAGHKDAKSQNILHCQLCRYMPQDISLYLEFSIGETLTYFGTLFGMSKVNIKSAKKFFIKLLHLPAESRFVETLR